MNALSRILAIYILLLAAIPCCAFDSCPDDKQELKEEHESGDEDCGTCSPFFSCEGCATATIVPQPAHWTFHPVSPSPAHSEYLPAPLSFMHFDFWQPPRKG